jgi:type I restriction enzyme S subunit
VKFDLMTIDEFGKLDRGRSRHRPRDDESLYGGKYPFIQTGDVKAAPFYITNYSQTYNERGLAQSKLWKRGTLCVTIAANIADTAILDFDACFPDSILGFVPFADKSNTKFVKYCFDVYKTTLEAISKGTTQDNLSLEKIKRVKFRIPPLPTQRKIAAILSAYDDLIENNNRRIAILEKMAEELYREWFVRLRFPGHEGVKIVKGVPEGWEVRKIGDLVTFDKGVSYSGEGLTETGTPMVNLKCFSINGGFRRDGVKPYSGPVRPQHIIKAGDIVIANTDLTQAGDIIGNPAIVPEIGEHQQYYFSHHLNAARLNPALNYRYYFYHLFKSPSFKGYSKGCASGTTVLGFRQGDLEKFAFFYPGEKLIKTFDELAQSLHRQIEILNKANDLQRESRDRLLARLMSGKIDVEKLDIQFPKSMLEQGEVERAEAKV